MNPCFIWVGLIGIPCSLCLRSQSLYFLSTVSPSRECLSSCCPDQADFIFRSSSNINTFWKLPDYAGNSQFCFLPRTMSMRYDMLKKCWWYQLVTYVSSLLLYESLWELCHRLPFARGDWSFNSFNAHPVAIHIAKVLPGERGHRKEM